MCLNDLQTGNPIYKIDTLPNGDLTIIEVTEQNIMIEDDFYDLKTAKKVLKKQNSNSKFPFWNIFKIKNRDHKDSLSKCQDLKNLERKRSCISKGKRQLSEI